MELSTLLPVLATAGTLGVLHGIEPDHAAGIASLTSEAGSRRISAILGACFAIGHVLLVLVWVGIAYAVLGVTDFPATFDIVGTLVVGGLLVGLSLIIGVVGARRLIHTHRHDHGDGSSTHTHVHLHLPSWLPTVGLLPDHDHDHSITSFFKIGVIGALFTLSPPLSMIAFISVIVPTTAGTLILLVVAAYGITIIATMAVIGGGIGTVFGAVRGRDERLHAMAQLVAAVVVFGLGLHLLGGPLL